MIRRLLALILIFSGSAGAEDREPSNFREFSDKRGQKLEARILSISQDKRQLQLERRDGQEFELAITVLSLDDQQFLRDWLNPPAPEGSGEIQVFGVLPGEKPIDTDALAGITDIASIHAMKQGWFARRETGEVITFQDIYPGLTEVRNLSVNTVWVALTKRDGRVGGARGGLFFPEKITDAVQCVAGSGHFAALLRDGTVKVWGKNYDTTEPIDPPTPLTGVVMLAATQSRIAAVHDDGRVTSWESKVGETHEAMLGDGAVEIEGNIFNFLIRTRSGEVYQLRNVEPEKAKIPKELESQGPFQKVRCNGDTRAAQKEDGSWIAWGANGAGIVDHINALGPVPDLAFFSEPGKKEHGYVIWVAP